MRNHLIILLTLFTAPQAFGQSDGEEEKSGTISISKTDTAKNLNTDSVIYEPEYGGDMLIKNRSIRFSPVFITNPKKTSTIEPPTFRGMDMDFEDYIVKNLRYPQLARDSSISGVVEVEFIIDLSGFVRTPRVTKGIGGGCDKEAIRLLRRLPRYYAAKDNGQIVFCRITKKIKFELE